MTGPVFKAEGLIWLVVGAFWVIAQIAGAAAKKNQPQRPTTDAESDKAPSDPFAEMLRKMAGVDEFRIEPPERVEEAVQPQKPAAVSRGRTSSVDVSSLPDIKPLQRRIVIPEAVEVQTVDLRPKMSAFRQSVPAIKLPAMNLSFRGSETSVQNAPNLGKILNSADRNSIRRAMLSHIIFSPPKALEQPIKP